MEAALGKRSNPYARRAFYMESDNDCLLSAWISVRREIVRIEKAIKACKVDYHPNLVPNLNWERFDVVMHTEELPKSEWYDSIVRVSFSEWAENEGLLPKDDTAVGPSQPQDEAAATAGATKERGNDLAIMGALVRITLGATPTT